MIRKLFVLLSLISFGGCVQPSKTVSIMQKKDSIVESKPLALQPDRFIAKFEESIDFIASGNEPFWSLEIDFDKSMHLKMPGGFEIISLAVESVKRMDANVIRYDANTEKGTLTVQIQKMECINDMSGKKSDYAVTIDTQNNTENDHRTYKGCGQYLADYRLQDIWVLDSINKTKIIATDFMKGAPLLEFNLTEKKFFGHTGCNNINAVIEVEGKKIHFGRLVSTRMACNNMNFELAYLKKIDNKIVPYQIKPGRLYMQVSSDTVFSYKKID